MNLKAVLEGLLFVVGDEGLTLEELKTILELDDDKLKETITLLEKDYISLDRGIEIANLGNRLKLVTKKEHKEYYQKLSTLNNDNTLSEQCLETLAIVAYNQPVTRSVVDEIRGISSSHMLRKLVFKNLICEVGRSETAGRPILYGTTTLFLDYFGLETITQLPTINILKDDTITELYDSKYNEEDKIIS
ncbi:MAG: SMC-Scp complex subunit ScpB [Bacilli bacterium]